MNKAGYLLLLLLCAGLLCGTTNVWAQGAGDKVLVRGEKQLRQSDVDGMIEFYEWALGAKFTGEERAKFQSLAETDFRNDPAASRKGVDDLLEMSAKVKALDENRRRDVRENFTADFVNTLRKTPEDETAKLLLSIYDGRGGASQPSVANGSDEEASGTAADVSALAGKWVWARTGGTTRSQGGSYVGGNGSRFTYQFSADGSVEYTGIMNVMAGGCSQQVFMSKKGRGRLSGDTLTIKWSPATSTRDFSCDRANNYTKTLPAETETLKVSFKNSSTGQRQLCTVSGGGGETCFSPAE
jgi:hypothetical protein